MLDDHTQPPVHRRQFRRWLYRFYYHGTSANYFLKRRIRPAGMGLLILGVVLASLAGGQASDPVFRILSFAFAIGALALLSLPFRRAKVSVVRETPSQGTAGQALPLTYLVTNHRHQKLTNAWLTENPGDPRPNCHQFLIGDEPGNHKRNAFDQLFSYYCWNWLCERKISFTEAKSPESIDLKGGQSERLTASIIPTRRGVLQLADLRLHLPDPLHLYQRHVKVPSSEANIPILPKRYRLPMSLALPSGSRLHPDGDTFSRVHGASGEFAGLRDYRAGDPLRLIHWRSWARTGRPIVKELEDNFFPRHAVLLDTSADPNDPDLFEGAVSVVASFVSPNDNRDRLVNLLLICGSTEAIAADSSSNGSDSMLRALATVSSSENEDHESLLRMLTRQLDDLGGVLAVFAGWSDAKAQLVARLRSTELATMTLVVARDRPKTLPGGVHFLHIDRLQDDLTKLPSQL